MRTATRIGAALLWLLVACDKDDGTRGWTVASSSSSSGDTTSAAADTGSSSGGSTTVDTGSGGGGGTTDAGATTSGDAVDSGATGSDGAAGDALTTHDVATPQDGSAPDAGPSPDAAVADTVTPHDVAGDVQTTPDAGPTAPSVSLQDINPNSPTYWDVVDSASLSGKVVLLAFHDVANTGCRARALPLESLRGTLEANFGTSAKVVAIAAQGGELQVANYATQGAQKVFFQILLDTIAADAWTAWGVSVNDMILVDLRGGAPGTIVERWTGVGQLDPTQQDQYDDLLQVIEDHLQ